MAKIGEKTEPTSSEVVFTPDLVAPSVGAGRPSGVLNRKQDVIRDEQTQEALKKEEQDKIIKLKKPNARALPKPQTKRMFDVASLMKYFDLLNDEDWSHLTAYLYRVYPKIIRQRSDKNNKNYIDVFGERFDVETILNLHGSGRYQVILLDSNDQKEAVTKAVIELSDEDKPPIYILEELDIEYPGNKGVVDRLKSEGKIGIDNKIAGSGMMPQNAGNDPALMSLVNTLVTKLTSEDRNKLRSAAEQGGDIAIKEAMAIMKDANKASMDILTQSIKGDSTEKTLELVKVITTMMKPEDKSGVMETIIKMQADSHKAQLDMMNQMVLLATARSKETEKDPIEQMLKMQELMDVLKGDTGKASKDGWKEKLIDEGLPMVASILQGFSLFMLSKQQAGATPGTAQSTIETPTAQPGLPQAQQAPQQPQQAPQTDILTQYGMFLVSAIARGESGDVFADSINVMLGPESGVVSQIQGQGKERVLAALQANTRLWEALIKFGEEKVKTFIVEFMEYKRGAMNEDDEPEDVKEPSE